MCRVECENEHNEDRRLRRSVQTRDVAVGVFPVRYDDVIDVV